MVKVPEMGPRDVGSVLEQGVLSTPEVAEGSTAAWEEGSDQQQGESRNWAAFSIFVAGVTLLLEWRRWDYLGKKKKKEIKALSEKCPQTGTLLCNTADLNEVQEIPDSLCVSFG